MLKRFFVTMLGSMAAIWLSFILFIIGTFVFFGMLIAKTSTGSVSSGKKVLHVKLAGTITDREQMPSLSELIQGTSTLADDNLESIINSIRLAKDDKDIEGIYIDCYGASLGVASRGEIVAALSDFKKSGKWIYSYADNYDQGDYYVASVADCIYLNPVGTVDIHGLQSQVLFYKDVLEKIGIDVEVLRVGSYKSAVEPFLRMDMSEESKEQTSVYLNSIWSDVTRTIADNRKVTTADINMWADSMSLTWPQEKYVSVKAVNELKYRNEVEDLIKDKLKIDKDKDIPLITPSQYVAEKIGLNDNIGKKHIAVLYAVGDIVDDGDESTNIAATAMVPQILKLAEDDNVKGLVLRVNSPGGSAYASEQIWHALEVFKKTGKPFYVSMGDYAASGGYYISCGADLIYSDPTTLTGSIGIFGLIPNANELLTQKIGFGFETVKTNPKSLSLNLFEKPSPENLAAMQNYINRGYETFTSRVAAGRKLPIDSVKAIGGGRVWDGAQAKKIGLVDKLGNLNMAVNDMADKLGLDSDAYVCYPDPESNVLSMLLKQSGKNIELNMTVNGLPAQEARQLYELTERIKKINPVQARMEKVIIK